MQKILIPMERNLMMRVVQVLSLTPALRKIRRKQKNFKKINLIIMKRKMKMKALEKNKKVNQLKRKNKT